MYSKYMYSKVLNQFLQSKSILGKHTECLYQAICCSFTFQKIKVVHNEALEFLQSNQSQLYFKVYPLPELFIMVLETNFQNCRSDKQVQVPNYFMKCDIFLRRSLMNVFKIYCSEHTQTFIIHVAFKIYLEHLTFKEKYTRKKRNNLSSIQIRYILKIREYQIIIFEYLPSIFIKVCTFESCLRFVYTEKILKKLERESKEQELFHPGHAYTKSLLCSRPTVAH